MSETTTDNPLQGTIGIIVLITFVLMSLIAMVVSISASSEIPSLARYLTIQIFCLTTFLGWFCFGASDNSNEYAKQFLIYAPFYGIFVSMIVIPSPILFWVGFTAYTGWGIFIRLRIQATADAVERIAALFDRKKGSDTNNTSRWGKIAPYLSIAWISSGLFLLIALVLGPYLPDYSTPLLEITETQTYLDWRLLITASFAAIFIAHSMVVTKRPARPNLERVEPHRFETFGVGRNLILRSLNLIIRVATAISVLFTWFRNLWRRTVKLVLYWLLDVGKRLYSDMVASFRNMYFYETILKEALTFLMILVVSKVVKDLTAPIRAFLTNQEQMTFVLDGNNSIFLKLVALFISCFVAINVLAWLWRLSSYVLEKTTISAGMILFGWSLVGVMTWILADLKLFHLTPYTFTFGIYYVATVGLLIAIVALFAIYKAIKGFIVFFRY